MSPLAPGAVFANRFEIDRTAGTGGMGTVYRASDRYTGERVALKLLHHGVAGSEEAERFAREASILAELRHPNIVAHVAHGQTPEGQCFLAMEWLEGIDLGQHLLRGPLSVRDCLQVARQVADGLALAHARAVIHRDIKPSNIFLVGGQLDQIKLLDFGLARRTTTLDAMTRTGVLLGTPQYMAPEQARGVRELGPAADVFSLGCVLYECLAGEPPFIADHIAAVLVRILFEEPTPLAERRRGVPAPVQELLLKLLRKEPGERLADGAALLGALDALGEVREDMLAATLASPRTQGPSFADEEQSLYSVVLAAPPAEDAGLAATLRLAHFLQADERQSMLTSLTALGVAADFLASGALVVTVPPMGSATDQATRAARAALLVKERWPGAMVSMATGRGLIRGRTAVGEVALLAARTHRTGSEPSSTGAGNGVLLDALSAKLLAGRFVQIARPGGALLLAEGKDVDTGRPLLGKPTPCVGREAELGTLEAQLGSCIEESEARVVLVTAPPGVGKSRLRHEFLRRLGARAEDVTVLLGRGDMMSAGAPYGILGAAIRQLCGLSGSEPIAEQQERLRERITRHVAASEQERVALFVGELCHLPFTEQGHPMLQAARQEPKIMRDCLRRAALDWLAAEYAAAPVVMVLDDLQWGDELTVSVLNEALREPSGTPLFVLAFARPEIHDTFPRLWQGHNIQEIALKGLSKKACERLIRQVLGKDLSAESMARVIEQSAGNALFLEELIRSLAEGKPEEQPDTVLAMLQARIARLDSGARRAVRAAAVFGQTFWRDGVAAVLGAAGSHVDVEAPLGALLDAELVQEHASSRLANQKEYGFRHALVRDAAYTLLTSNDLTTGHCLAAQFLEAAGEHDAAVIAEHFERGGEPLRAAGGYLRAAEASLARGNYRDVLRQVERGVGCGPEGELLALLRSAECHSALWLDRHDRMGEATPALLARLRPGSLGWCRVLAPALVLSMIRQDAAGMGELAGLLLATEPDADAQAVSIETLGTVYAFWVFVAPVQLLQAVQQKLAACIAQAELVNPSIRRFLPGCVASRSAFREPAPWTLVTNCQEILTLCEQAGDSKFQLFFRGSYLELGWLDLGDLEGVRQRLTALTPAMEASQEMHAVGLWRHLLARILCMSDAESDWLAAEQLVAPLLGSGGSLLYALRAQEVMVRLALRRGQLQQGEAGARALMQYFPSRPVLLAPTASLQIGALLAMNRASEAVAVAEQVLATLPVLGGIGVFEVEFRLLASEAFHAAGDPTRAHVELQETLRQIQRRADDITDSVWRTSYLTRNPHCVRAIALARERGLDDSVAMTAAHD